MVSTWNNDRGMKMEKRQGALLAALITISAIVGFWIGYTYL